MAEPLLILHDAFREDQSVELLRCGRVTTFFLPNSRSRQLELSKERTPTHSIARIDVYQDYATLSVYERRQQPSTMIINKKMITIPVSSAAYQQSFILRELDQFSTPAGRWSLEWPAGSDTQTTIADAHRSEDAGILQQVVHDSNGSVDGPDDNHCRCIAVQSLPCIVNTIVPQYSTDGQQICNDDVEQQGGCGVASHPVGLPPMIVCEEQPSTPIGQPIRYEPSCPVKPRMLGPSSPSKALSLPTESISNRETKQSDILVEVPLHKPSDSSNVVGSKSAPQDHQFGKPLHELDSWTTDDALTMFSGSIQDQILPPSCQSKASQHISVTAADPDNVRTTSVELGSATPVRKRKRRMCEIESYTALATMTQKNIAGDEILIDQGSPCETSLDVPPQENLDGNNEANRKPDMLVQLSYPERCENHATHHRQSHCIPCQTLHPDAEISVTHYPSTDQLRPGVEAIRCGQSMAIPPASNYPVPIVVFSATTSIIKNDGSVMNTFRELRGVVVSQVRGANVLCFGRNSLRKTAKFILAVALGMDIVTDGWLADCHLQNKLLDPRDYIPKDHAKEKEWKFNLLDAITRNRGGMTLLNGFDVFLTLTLQQELDGLQSDLKDIALAMGARSVKMKLPEKIREGQKVMIIGSPNDDAQGAEVTRLKERMYTRDILSMSVLRGRLDLESDEFCIERPIKEEED